jgi:7,8-dihydropterin-6-yl-methyl-4-(beta-D-ribofuranosyl)aminobenzene 5'-phosphate synthase
VYAEEMTITVIYNNKTNNVQLTSSWGMGCVVRGLEKTILFDTGGDGKILLSNMKKMEINPKEIDVVVLSHIHKDHTGGLQKFLGENSNVEVYLPPSFSRNFKRSITLRGAHVVEVKDPVEISSGIYSTGTLENTVKEQALITKSAMGLFIVTGCSHPGIVTITRKVKELFDENIYLITGGFHLTSASIEDIDRMISDLQTLGVEKIAPSHCTGEKAMVRFKDIWDKDFINGGCGAHFLIPIEEIA